MKVRIFIATLAAASLLSFGAFAHGHSGVSISASKGGTVNIAVISQQGYKSNQTAVIAQDVSVSLGGWGW